MDVLQDLNVEENGIISSIMSGKDKYFAHKQYV